MQRVVACVVMPKNQSSAVEMTNEVIVAFLSKNAVEPGIITDLMRSVHATLVELEKLEAKRVKLAAMPPQTPAISIDQSVSPEFVFCLECGRRLKTLKFHIAGHGLSPKDYLAKWELPVNHPLIAPSLAAKRSALALNADFGHSRMRKRNV